MSNFFIPNIKYLKKKMSITQSDIGFQVGKKGNTIGYWEAGKGEPDMTDLIKLSQYFDISIENLLFTDLSKGVISKKTDKENLSEKGAIKGANKGAISLKNIEVPHGSERDFTRQISRMPTVVTVDEGGNENIVHVPVKARAGYLLGYGDTEYIQQLPAYKLPGLRNGTYRSFEVDGVSMTPGLYPGDFVIGEWCENLENIRDDRVYIVVTKTLGVVIKRVLNRIQQRGKLYLKSDTLEYRDQYPTLELDPSEVHELWYSRLHISNQFGHPGGILKQFNDLTLDVIQLKKEMAALKQPPIQPKSK